MFSVDETLSNSRVESVWRHERASERYQASRSKPKPETKPHHMPKRTLSSQRSPRFRPPKPTRSDTSFMKVNTADSYLSLLNITPRSTEPASAGKPFEPILPRPGPDHYKFLSEPLKVNISVPIRPKRTRSSPLVRESSTYQPMGQARESAADNHEHHPVSTKGPEKLQRAPSSSSLPRDNFSLVNNFLADLQISESNSELEILGSKGTTPTPKRTKSASLSTSQQPRRTKYSALPIRHTEKLRRTKSSSLPQTSGTNDTSTAHAEIKDLVAARILGTPAPDSQRREISSSTARTKINPTTDELGLILVPSYPSEKGFQIKSSIASRRSLPPNGSVQLQPEQPEKEFKKPNGNSRTPTKQPKKVSEPREKETTEKPHSKSSKRSSKPKRTTPRSSVFQDIDPQSSLSAPKNPNVTKKMVTFVHDTIFHERPGSAAPTPRRRLKRKPSLEKERLEV